MRSNAWQKGVVLLSVLAISSFGVSTRAHQQVAKAETANKQQLEQRIERVEYGLLPPVVLKGETPVRMRIDERMRFYRTPGVSVAVINEGQVEWARGYGVLSVNGQKRVTTDTIFQAASISKTLTAIASLQLVEKHKLNLDEDVNVKLAGWKVPENDLIKTERPTLRRVLSDLAQLVIEIQRSNAGKSNQILSKEMTKLMLSPQIENIGLGVLVDGQGPSARFNSSGSNVGYKSYAVGYLQTGQGAVVMTNSENGGQLALEILRSISAEYGWPDYRPKERVISKIDPGAYDDYVGEYELAPGAVDTITREGDKLMSHGPQQPRAEMLPESPNTFFLKEVDASFTFIRDEKGQVVEVIIRRGGRDYKAKRIR